MIHLILQQPLWQKEQNTKELCSTHNAWENGTLQYNKICGQMYCSCVYRTRINGVKLWIRFMSRRFSMNFNFVTLNSYWMALEDSRIYLYGLFYGTFFVPLDLTSHQPLIWNGKEKLLNISIWASQRKEIKRFSNDIFGRTTLLIYDLDAETQKKPYAWLMNGCFYFWFYFFVMNWWMWFITIYLSYLYVNLSIVMQYLTIKSWTCSLSEIKTRALASVCLGERVQNNQ